jgi:hypothetical protein
MSKDKENEGQETLQQQLRRGQRFSIGDAIGREGGGYMKDASSVPWTKEAAAAVHRLLADHLVDTTGCARQVLESKVTDDLVTLGRHRAAPAGAILERIDRLLANEASLQEFVRRVDTEWGRQMVERPHFERPGRPPHPDDEYTHASVRRALQGLADRLRELAP